MSELFKDLFYLIMVFILVWVVFYLFTRHDTVEQRILRYDCRISEFSPDFPNDIRQECRRRALEQYNQQRMEQQ
jgi:hypothetical protein